MKLTKKKISLIVSAIVVVLVAVVFIIGSNGYERVEKETWKAICNKDADKLMAMYPDEFLDNVSKELKVSKKALKENLESNLKDIKVEYSDLTFEFGSVEEGYTSNGLDEYLDYFAEMFDYEAEPSKWVKVKIHDNNNKYSNDYCLKIGNRWYSVTAMTAIYEF